MKPGKKAGRFASRMLTVLLSLALFITMMPLGFTAVFAADAADYQPALTITEPDGNVKTYQTRDDVIEAFGFGTDDSSFGVALEGIFVKKLLSGYDDDAVVTVQTQDDYTGTLNASGKTVKELKSLKGILAYKEGDAVYDPTSDEVNAKGKKLYGGYFKFYVGKDADGNVLVDKWVNRITISNAGGTEPEPVPAAALTVKGEGLTKELSFESVKALKNDEAIKPLILEGVKFHTVNSYGTEEDFTVAGVTIESLIGLAGIKGGYELESVTAVSDNETKGKTYSADEILKEDLQGNKSMLIWGENGDKVLKTAVGQFAAGEQNRGKWWKAKDSITLTVTAKKVTKPGKPKVTLAAGKKKVTVKWKRVTGAEGYVIYRSTKKTKGFKKIKTIKSGKTLKYVNKKLKGGKRYYYKVKAYKKDFNGNKVLSYYSAVKYTKTKR